MRVELRGGDIFVIDTSQIKERVILIVGQPTEDDKRFWQDACVRSRRLRAA